MQYTVKHAVNNNKELRLTDLRKNHIVVILYLDKTGQALLFDIRKAITGGRYAAGGRYTEQILLDLKRMGLVREFNVRHLRFFELTEKGKKVAEFLKKFKV